MTIEVRQLTIRSSVGGEAPAERGEGDAPAMDDDLQRQLREQVLVECKRWLVEWLRNERER